MSATRKPLHRPIQAIYDVAVEMPTPQLNDVVTLYCRWMIRLYLERQIKQDQDSQLGAA